MRHPRIAGCLFGQCVVGLCLAGPAVSQTPDTPLTRPTIESWPATPLSPAFKEQEQTPTTRAVLSSLVVPGAGQWLQGQRRWIAYLALESTAVLFTLERRRSGSTFRDSYRDLAWSAARGGEALGRIDLDFPYYERVANFTTSGEYDADPSMAGVQPESDPATYNGSVWELAQGIYLGGTPNPTPSDAGYAQALEYYLERGYDDRFLWDWDGKETDRAEYRRLISQSDEAFRTGTVLLGVAVANHLVSAIDALVSTRARTLNLDQHLEFSGTPILGPRGHGAAWELQLRVMR